MEIIHRLLNISSWDIYQKLYRWKEMQPKKIILHFDDAFYVFLHKQMNICIIELLSASCKLW